MRAVVVHAPHDLRVETREPEALGPGQVAVAVEAGGICGSDLHYYHDGGFGTIRLREPMILGHEVAGRVAEIGAGVTGLEVGQLVAVNPSHPCGTCKYCQAGVQQHCLDMRFFGSAMRNPHFQGAFRDRLVVPSEQCVPFRNSVPAGIAAFAEPLAVCLHAVNQAGSLAGKRVLVTGYGPIGALTSLAVRWAGAREVVVTDVASAPLGMAERLGVDQAINTREDPGALEPFARDKGHFDVLFEASGAPAALLGALAVVRPGGVLVQVGIGAPVELPMNVVVAKELQIRGTFRFHEEFALAVALLDGRRIDVAPLLTATLGMEEAVAAFELASDRSRAMKVQLSFQGQGG